MRSKTKQLLKNDTIEKICYSLGISNIGSVSSLGAGMFNAIYSVNADNRYVIKVAPDDRIPVMTYEKDMIKAELFWYKVIAENTDIPIPKIYGSDFSHDIVNSDLFVMERLDGVHRNAFKSPDCDKLFETVSIISRLHSIKGERFGYIQNQLYDNWFDAICSIIQNLLLDLQRVGKSSKEGERLFEYAKKHGDILRGAPCVAVNFDLWDLNLICRSDPNGKPIFALIDPERSMWGDPILDFICLESFFAPLDNKTKSIEYYNRISDIKVEINRESMIRYAIAQGLMALIQETEKYYRFRPVDKGWIIDVISSNVLYKRAFKVLKNE